MTNNVKDLKISVRHATGRLLLPVAPNGALGKKVATNLRGASTFPDWIPEGLSPELDDLRATHLRLRNQCAAELTELDSLTARFRAEDTSHADELRSAAALGRPVVADERTPDTERQAAYDATLEKLWANVEVLADHCDLIVQTIREQEPQLLASLRVGLNSAQEAVREAQRLLDESRRDEWAAHRRGQWVLQTSEDREPFGRQPAPDPSETMPANFDRGMLATSLERPWWKSNGGAVA